MKKASLKSKIILGPLYILPRPIKKAVAYALTFFCYRILRLRVSLVKSQIKKVFPNKSNKEIDRIAFKSYFNLAMVLFEYSYFPFGPKRILKHTKIVNKENYEKHLNNGESVFFVTGHMANGEIILFRVCLEGVKLNLIGKRVGVKAIDSLLFEVRELSGLKHIPPKNGAHGIMEASEKKEPVVFVNDQFRHPPRGLKTTFLGLETYTNSAPAFFALKTGAKVIPVNMYREGEKVVVDFRPEIPFEKKYESDEENIRHMTQVYNDELEEFIRERPEEWMWVHKRWKKL